MGRYGADVEGAPNRYIPFATSYDVDAPITEYGYPTEKYYLCKAALKEYLEKTILNSQAVRIWVDMSAKPKAYRM